MQVLSFPSPESVVQEQVVSVLEDALAAAKRGEVSSVVVVTLDDSDDTDSIGFYAATDSWTQTAGMLVAAQRAL
jgi:hypothetical protein